MARWVGGTPTRNPSHAMNSGPHTPRLTCFSGVSCLSILIPLDIKEQVVRERLEKDKRTHQGLMILVVYALLQSLREATGRSNSRKKYSSFDSNRESYSKPKGPSEFNNQMGWGQN